MSLELVIPDSDKAQLRQMLGDETVTWPQLIQAMENTGGYPGREVDAEHPTVHPTPQTFENVIERLTELLYLPEGDNDTRPTRRAFAAVLDLLLATRQELAGDMPDAVLATTDKGGINVYWRKPNFTVQLIIAGTSARTDYIYVRELNPALLNRLAQSTADTEVSPARLAHWLRQYQHHSLTLPETADAKQERIAARLQALYEWLSMPRPSVSTFVDDSREAIYEEDID